MKYLMTIFFFITTLFVFGQNDFDFGQLTNKWTEGKIDQNGKVVMAEINRGGHAQLVINADSTVIEGGRPNCGFGHQREGKWLLNKTDTTTTFTFSKRVGYMNSKETANISEIEIYKIVKLTSQELILTRKTGCVLMISAYIRYVE